MGGAEPKEKRRFGRTAGTKHYGSWPLFGGLFSFNVLNNVQYPSPWFGVVCKWGIIETYGVE
ncbi:uncharacterized protein GLRG_01536 [Colletotrichum graminicola M1.001]|uniref:Uncharacterized protein n=1 Tax=Colletotrichum graminicola (strain M1.001 / M2 / FGSC 10212) TaxID=645133 RepID=E3Q6E4_COLGM|nr:uncharacterized protein GLRG_01536 [Colletotrichum graminicola M1.001]EFQ26392.1 hypothetical protein GLRG_01536 [Colletotrichum graminicola M1.001]